jgi:hypothetical protein
MKRLKAMKRIYTVISVISLMLVFLMSAFAQVGSGNSKPKRQLPVRRGTAALGTYSTHVGPDVNGIKQRNRQNRNGAQGTGNRRMTNTRSKGFYIDDIIIGNKNPKQRKETGKP